MIASRRLSVSLSGQRDLGRWALTPSRQLRTRLLVFDSLSAKDEQGGLLSILLRNTAFFELQDLPIRMHEHMQSMSQLDSFRSVEAPVGRFLPDLPHRCLDRWGDLSQFGVCVV